MNSGTNFLIIASILWGFVHSALASHGFKAWLRRLAGEAAFRRLYRFSYNVFSAASFFPILAALTLLPDKILYTIPAPWVYLTSILQGLAAMALIAGVMETDPWAFVGLKQLGGGEESAALVTSGLYAWVRHPLYSAGLLFIWLTPQMTVNRLTLWSILSLYILIGAWFEERKLRRDFGEAYAQYAAKTPMLIPNFWRK
ncbi:MAG: isoprenylcysteine carboxylmethyltransferase family protein [Anaerolineales bacterium]